MQHYPLTDEQHRCYLENGFVRLEAVFSAEEVRAFETDVTTAVAALHNPQAQKPPNSDTSAYDAAFTQVMNIWRRSAAVKELVFNRRLARIAAELMQVQGVRLYHDQALYKEAHGGYTPWHCDQYYWPLSGDNTITAWIPLQDTALDMGALAFSAGSHRVNLGRDLPIGAESEREIADRLRALSLRCVEEPFAIGDVSFHSGWTFHRAGPNRTARPRCAMTVIYMEDGICLKAPENDNQIADWQAWCPGAEVGAPVATPLNPVLYSRQEK